MLKSAVFFAVTDESEQQRENCVLLCGDSTTGKSWLLEPFWDIYVCHAAPALNATFPFVGPLGERKGEHNEKLPPYCNSIGFVTPTARGHAGARRPERLRGVLVAGLHLQHARGRHRLPAAVARTRDKRRDVYTRLVTAAYVSLRSTRLNRQAVHFQRNGDAGSRRR